MERLYAILRGEEPLPLAPMQVDAYQHWLWAAVSGACSGARYEEYLPRIKRTLCRKAV